MQANVVAELVAGALVVDGACELETDPAYADTCGSAETALTNASKATSEYMAAVRLIG